LDPILRETDINDKNQVMALHALFLVQGNTLLATSIKSDTVKRYLQAAAYLSTLANQTDPRLDIYGKNAAPVQKVLQEQKRWEEMPKRREPVTVEMINHMWESCKNLPMDSLEYALFDWNVLGRYYGFRLSEWAQNKENCKNFPLQAVDGTPLAFIFQDFTFATKGRKTLQQNFSKKLSKAKVETVTVRWRYQKNLDNGQEIMQTRNREDPKMCPVLAAWRIRERARRLTSSSEETLAKFRNNKGKVEYVTNIHIANHLQQAAAAAYHITDKRALSRWTAHSIRVGACVGLQEAEKDGPYIQMRLRWRSLAFMDYLRNTITLAKQHVQSFINA